MNNIDMGDGTLFIENASLEVHDSDLSKMVIFMSGPSNTSKCFRKAELNIVNSIVGHIDAEYCHFDGDNATITDVCWYPADYLLALRNSKATMSASTFKINNCEDGNNKRCVYAAASDIIFANSEFIGISLINVQQSNVLITNCTLAKYTSEHDSIISAREFSNVSVTNSKFEHNRCLSVIFMQFDSNLRIENSTFLHNNGDYGAAVVVSENSTLLVIESHFEGNHGMAGGAIYAVLCIKIQVIGCVFYKNMAHDYQIEIGDEAIRTPQFGGAIAVNNNLEVLIDLSNFTSNNASNVGGAIAGYDKGHIRISSCQFFNNVALRGGAMWFKKSVKVEIVDAMFAHNAAVDKSETMQKNGFDLCGGAIAADDNVTVDVERSQFVGNSASYIGGALCFIDNIFIRSMQNEFVNNTSTFGGAVSLQEKASAVFLASAFKNNEAEIKSKVIKKDYEGKGGAINVRKSNITIEDCVFSGNKGYQGGALFLWWDVHLILRNTSFLYNEVYKNPSVSDKPFRIRNLSGVVAGALYVTNSTSTVTMYDTLFHGNKAMEQGGSIYADSGARIIIYSTVFEDNLSHDDGGGVYLISDVEALIFNSTFINNTAIAINMSNVLQPVQPSSQKTGGAIKVVGNSTLKVESSIFVSNKAHEGGGLYVRNAKNINVTKCAFQMNIASEAAAIFGIQSGSTITHSSFSKNRAFTSVITSWPGKKLVLKYNVFADNHGAYVMDVVSDDTTIYMHYCTFENNIVHHSTFQVMGRNRELLRGSASPNSVNVSIKESTFINNSNAHAGGSVEIDVMYSHLHVKNSYFIGNSAEENGGAIITYGAKIITIVNSFFQNNTSGNYGGAVQVNSERINDTTLIIEGCDFVDNHAAVGDALAINNCTDIVIDSCSFISTAEYIDCACGDDPRCPCATTLFVDIVSLRMAFVTFSTNNILNVIFKKTTMASEVPHLTTTFMTLESIFGNSNATITSTDIDFLSKAKSLELIIFDKSGEFDFVHEEMTYSSGKF